MKIFSVIKDSVCEGEKSFHLLGTYVNLSEAIKRLKDEFEQAKEDYSYQDSEHIVYEYDEDNNTCFDVYEDGYYDLNHISCSVEESELEINTTHLAFENLVFDQMEQINENKDDKEFSEIYEKMSDEEKNTVASEISSQMMNDDEMWQSIDESLNHFIFHHPKFINRRGD